MQPGAKGNPLRGGGRDGTRMRAVTHPDVGPAEIDAALAIVRDVAREALR